MTDYTELKRLAEAATAGPWSMCGEADGSQGFEIIQDIWNEHGTHTGKDVVVYEWSDESDPLGVIHRADAEFIAAANPVAVLALIAENERLRVDLKSVVRLNNENADLFKEKNDQLRAEIAGFKTGYKAYERVNAELKAEVEGLRKAAGEVLSWIEAKHRPPVADQVEHGRMALVRLHALAELDAALGQGEQS